MNKITRDDTEHGVEYVRADEAQAEVLEQCRIIAMGAEREDALRAELTRLKANIALDWMAKNARELGLDYEPAPAQEPIGRFTGRFWTDDAHNRMICEIVCDVVPTAGAPLYTTPPAAQPAVQEGRDWSLLEATQESLREHMAEIKRLKAAQPVPVKTYHDGKPWPVAPVPDGPYSAPIKELWPVAPKPWVALTKDDVESWDLPVNPTVFEFAQFIEIKLKELNHV
jgi:hypothetical protein